MIDDTQLSELASLSSDQGIVSLYLGIEPRLRYDRGIALRKARSAWKHFERTESRSRWKEAAEREKGRIFDFLTHWTPDGRGVAIFACEPAGIWRVVPLEAPIPTTLQVDSTTHTAILAALVDELPRFAVVVVQRDQAVLYVSEQGRREELKRIESEVPGSHDQGGWAQARLSRHIEFHVSEHMREVVEALEALQAVRPYSYLLLGGTAETTAALEKRLPGPLAEKVIGSFPVDVKHVTDDDVVEKALALRERKERDEENALVERILSEASAGGQGALGTAEVLRALLEGKVRELALEDDLVVKGSECVRCGYLAPSPVGACPLCGSPAEEVSNVAERAVERAYLSGAKVNFVYGKAREKLKASGGIGALLRY